MFDIIAQDPLVICMFDKNYPYSIHQWDMVQIGNGILHCISKGTSH